MSENILLASQGIYGRRRELFGTELLFRNDNGSTAFHVGENVATGEVLVNLCSSITSEVAHLQRPAFINVSADFLLSEAFLPVDARYIFIELVERIQVDEEVIRAVGAWKQRGFRFALDDFEFSADWLPLLKLADVVKVDVLDCDPEVIRRRKQSLRDYAGIWLAERVETEEEFEAYAAQGFDLFQGYFLSRPKLIRGKNIRPEQASAAEILRVTAGDGSFDELARVVERDPKLSIQILKLVNSPLYSLERPIESIREAIVFLGIGQLRKWALVLTLLATSGNTPEAHRIVLKRAKFCEFYAREIGAADADRAFMVGLLSGLDILLGVEPHHFISTIRLSEDMAKATLEYEGRLGKILKLAQNLERLSSTYPERLVNNKQAVLDVYHQSFFWTEEILRCFAVREMG